MASTNLVEVTSPEHFKDLLSADLNRVSVLNFWASWAEPCEEFNKVIEQESKAFEQVLFLNVSVHLLRKQLEDADQQIEAETLADISESFDIEAVPSFLLLRVRAVTAPAFPCRTTKPFIIYLSRSGGSGQVYSRGNKEGEHSLEETLFMEGRGDGIRPLSCFYLYGNPNSHLVPLAHHFLTVLNYYLHDR